jgi:hypothetical protein
MVAAHSVISLGDNNLSLSGFRAAIPTVIPATI